MLCGCIVEHIHHVFTEICMRLFQVWRSALLAGQSEDRNLILQPVSVWGERLLFIALAVGGAGEGSQEEEGASAANIWPLPAPG